MNQQITEMAKKSRKHKKQTTIAIDVLAIPIKNSYQDERQGDET